MDYIRTDAAEQLVLEHSSSYFLIPSYMYGSHNTETTERTTKSGRSVFVRHGSLEVSTGEPFCEHCGECIHINDHHDITLQNTFRLETI